MTITSTRPTGTSSQTRGRVAAVAALGFAFCFFWTVAVMNVPHDPTDAELVDWWQDSGNRFTGIASSLFAVGAAILLAVVVDHVRRVPAAANAPAWLGFARSMGAAFTATLLVRDNEGGIGTATRVITVVGSGTPPAAPRNLRIL